jgi:hypothetical protein
MQALWIQASAAIVAGTIAAAQTITVYGVIYTVASVTTVKFGAIVFTDPNGNAYAIPNYACPLAAYDNQSPYNAPENTES